MNQKIYTQDKIQRVSQQLSATRHCSDTFKNPFAFCTLPDTHQTIPYNPVFPNWCCAWEQESVLSDIYYCGKNSVSSPVPAPRLQKMINSRVETVNMEPLQTWYTVTYVYYLLQPGFTSTYHQLSPCRVQKFSFL